MIKINLIGEGKRPAAVRKRKEISAKIDSRNLANILLIVGLVAGLAATGAEWWLLKQEQASKKERVQALQKEFDALKPIIKEVEQFKKKTSELEKKIGIINDLKLNQRGPVKVMDSISKALPELVWLDRMEINRGRIKLIGQASNENAIANFIENLDRIEEFREPVFRHMRENRQDLFAFEISLRFKPKKKREEQQQQAAAAAGGA